MKKRKKLLKMFSFVLILVFGVGFFGVPSIAYASKNDSQFGDYDTYNYNLFNMTIQPFLTDDEGKGLYYAGYVPEIQYSKLTEFDSEDNIEIMDYLIKYPTENDIYISFNSFKTMWYYYDGNTYEIFASRVSDGFTRNSRGPLSKFLEVVGFPISATASNAQVYYYLRDNNYIFDNYALTCDTVSDRSYSCRWDPQHVYGCYYPDLIQYGLNQKVSNQLYKVFKYVSNVKNYMTAPFYISGYSITFYDYNKDDVLDNEDYIVLEWDNTSNGDNQLANSVNEFGLVREIFCFDFQNTTNSKLERVYLTREQLEAKGSGNGFSISDGKLIYQISALKKMSKLCVDGEIDNIWINGIGMQFAMIYDLDHLEIDYVDFKNNDKYWYSNNIYFSFLYELSSSLPSSSKIYRLSNTYDVWDLKYKGYPLTPNGDYLPDGDDTTNNDYITPDGKVDYFSKNFIGKILIEFLDTMDAIIGFIKDIPSLIDSMFSFLPASFRVLMISSLSTLSVIAIIKFIRG